MSLQFFSEHREYLKREYEARLSRRPLYSQRAFARDIGLSSSALNDYFNGRIRLSSGRVAQVSKSIGLTTEQRQHWIDLLEMKYAKAPEIKKISELRVKSRMQSQSHSISLDQFKVISDWYHLAYVELIQMDAEKYSDLKVSAAALGLPLKSLKLGVKRLEDLTLLKKDANGFYTVNPSTTLGDNIPSMAVRQFHSQMIKKANAALEEQPMQHRFASSTMVALPKAEIEKIMADIKFLALKYLDPYLVQSQNSKKDALYGFTLQFFDLLAQKESSL
ncbi:MAG: TIGR02147 family protein [Bdellovibrionaceae bacterium]|nr:TIGR02147 family protein [Bdellovibrio sp.]